MNGLVLLNKPAGFTSFDVVAVMRKVLQTRKIGHTGTLDPMATGVLPLLVGKATRLCNLLPCEDKVYKATLQFGVTTDTLDITGKVQTTAPAAVTPEQVRELLPRFTGSQLQIPPMYSAISVNGVRLYDLARNGQTIQREPRSVIIHSLTYVSGDFTTQQYTFEVACSKGTYIRSLVRDIGEVLGCGAVLTALCRTKASGFSLSQCVTLEQAKNLPPQTLLLPAESALQEYPSVRVTAAQAKRFQNGGPLDRARLPLSSRASGLFRVYAPDQSFIGLGRIDGENNVLKLQCLL